MKKNIQTKMKKVFLGLLVLSLFAVVAGCGESSKQTENKAVKLGIIQIAEHPALDAARKGFLDTLAKNGYEEGKNLEVDYQNAQGDQATLQSIASKFVQDKKDLILAIATPSAMAMANDNVTQAARLIGMTRAQLAYRLEKIKGE